MWINQIIKNDINKLHLKNPFYLKLDNRALFSESQNSQTSSKSQSLSKSIEDNPYYSKYSEKIKQALKNQNSEIIESSSLNQKLSSKMISDHYFKSLSNNVSSDASSKFESNKNSSKFELTSINQSFKLSSTFNTSINFEKPKVNNHIKSLNELVRLDLLQQRSSEEITSIWQDYYKCKENFICGVISSSKYNQIITNGQKYATFIYPLAKKQVTEKSSKEGLELILGQFDKNKVYFTPLIMYHMHQENAPVILSIQHFEELRQEKNIVLMQGIFDSNHINSIEAQCLINQFQIYYLGTDSTKIELLEKLNHDPENFDYQEVIKNFEKGLL